MSSRALLGAADLGDEELATMVASLLGEQRVELLDLEVSLVGYDLPSITTAGRHWVSGHAATASGPRPFRIFVKHVQCWSRSPTEVIGPDNHHEVLRLDVHAIPSQGQEAATIGEPRANLLDRFVEFRARSHVRGDVREDPDDGLLFRTTGCSSGPVTRTK